MTSYCGMIERDVAKDAEIGEYNTDSPDDP